MRATGVRTNFPVGRVLEIVVLIAMSIVAVAACASGQASKPGALKTLPAAVDEPLNKAVATYLAISEKLASDSIDSIAEQARALAEHLKAAGAVKVGGQEFGQANAELASCAAKAMDLSRAVDLPAARRTFAELSDDMVKLVERTGVPASLGGEFYRMHCPMYREEKGGAIWIQQGDKIRNPYWGKKMMTCADKKTPLPLAVAVSDDAAASQPAGQGKSGISGQ